MEVSKINFKPNLCRTSKTNTYVNSKAKYEHRSSKPMQLAFKIHKQSNVIKQNIHSANWKAGINKIVLTEWMFPVLRCLGHKKKGLQTKVPVALKIDIITREPKGDTSLK